MPRGVKKNLDAVAKKAPSREPSGRQSKTLAEQRIKGDAPAIGLVIVAVSKPKAKKPALKKTNSKGEVIKRKGATVPYYSLIKRCLKQDQSPRKGTSRQALAKFIEANRGECQPAALKRALAKAVADGKLVQKGKVRYSLTKKERTKKKRTTKKKSGEKKEKKEKKDKKDKKSKKASKKKKTEKEPQKTNTVAKKLVSKSPKVASTRGVPKAKSVSATAVPSDSASATADSGDNVWVWQYYDGGFHNYDSAASDIVEGVYQEYLSSPYTCDVRAVKSGQWQYEIDFRVMTQTNIQHEDHTKRRIRRIQVPANEKGTKKNYGGDEMYTHVPEKVKK